MRAAFVAGLAMGMERQLLLLQSGDEPVPLDYRDLARSFKFLGQIDDYVADFATAVVASMQSWVRPISDQPETLLSRLTLGASSAENEYQELGDYYLETDEFRRAVRGEVQIVLGRKGSGKTALFFQLRDRLRRDRRIVVLDLKPEGFQLLKFKEQVLDLLEEGTREHTITAFWEYLLLLEICHKLLQKDRTLHMRNHNLFEPYQQLAATYDSDEYVAEGDFAERMLRLTQRIAEDFAGSREEVEALLRMSTEEVTELLYKHNLHELRSQLATYLSHKDAIWILFDNLDKGWPPHGVGPEDVLSLRCLLDAMGKMEREFSRQKITTRGIVFIRNDVFENLVAAMPDRGKISHALVDWTDPALLLEVLRRRFLCSGIDPESDFESIWNQICVPMMRGEASAYYMVDRCLMRPRALIDFLRHCRSHAVNLGHTQIGADDINQGEERYSTQLVNDVSYEIQDVYPPASNVLYEFIESPARLDENELTATLTRLSTDPEVQARTLDLLLWYGVLGFQRAGGDPSFIYSVRYDFRRLRALLANRAGEGIIYVINPAFWKGLEIDAQQVR